MPGPLTPVRHGRRRTPFLDTSSIGPCPEMVRRRDRRSHRVGKWLARTVTAAEVLRTQSPVSLASAVSR